MRLINVNTGQLEEFLDYKTPPYAILSHTWGDDAEELTFNDVAEGRTDKPGVGSVKFRGSCQQAKVNGLKYVWIDTCCIDKTNLGGTQPGYQLHVPVVPACFRLLRSPVRRA